MSRLDRLIGLVNRSCLATFGIPVSYTPSLRNRPELEEQPIAITGIFDDRRVNLTLMGAGLNGIEAVVPQTTLELRLSDLGFDPMPGDEVTVNGLSYQVMDAQPNGTGLVTLTIVRMQDPLGT